MTKRVAVVTGTSRGIGLSIAKQLAERGLKVIATSRDAIQGKKAADEMGLPFHALDVSSQKSVDAFAAHLKETEGGLDVLVNNAGVSLDGFDANVARRTLEVNFFGAVRMTDTLLPLMRPHGRIVMISSGMGELACLGKDLQSRFGEPTLTRQALFSLVNRFVEEVAAKTHEGSGWPSNAYRVSKVAMNAFVRVLARELTEDPRGIKVNAACPGWVRTGMGGRTAPLTPDEGARTPLWLATLPEDGPIGGFFRAERAIPW
jgi:NAD(P)-dependent dehydrogenase (short-subunit alcohol dehydrogenase family)